MTLSFNQKLNIDNDRTNLMRIAINNLLLFSYTTDVNITMQRDLPTFGVEYGPDRGYKLSDHASKQPKNITLKLVIFDTNSLTKDDILSQLKDWYENTEFLTVTTPFDSYDNMLIKDLRITPKRKSLNAWTVTVEFQEVRRAQIGFRTIESDKVKVDLSNAEITRTGELRRLEQEPEPCPNAPVPIQTGVSSWVQWYCDVISMYRKSYPEPTMVPEEVTTRLVNTNYTTARNPYYLWRFYDKYKKG